MKGIALLRHGHAETGPSDFNRTLSPRGYMEVQSVALKISARLGRPDRVISSPAKRAIETAGEYLKQPAGKVSFETNEELYAATEEDLLRLLAELPEKFELVLLVGHNPSFEDLIISFTHERTRLKPGFCYYMAVDIDEWPEIFLPANILEKILFTP